MSDCANCYFAGDTVPDMATMDVILECRRRAPLVTGGMMSNIETVWPRVKSYDWCGDYQENRSRPLPYIPTPVPVDGDNIPF